MLLKGRLQIDVQKIQPSKNFQSALYTKSLTMPSSNIAGFHVTLYQDIFANHQAHDRHVGFLFAPKDMMSRYFFSS